MDFLSRLVIFAFVISALGCASRTVPSTSRTTTSRSADLGSYNEDLTAVRPVYAPAAPAAGSKSTPAERPAPAPAKPAGPPLVTPTNVARRLDAVLDTMAQQNRRIRYAPGYRIQIYVGNERQAADAAKLQVYQLFPELSPYLAYQQPTYRLKVGDFIRRMDAERYLSLLRQQFKAALMQPDKVDIRRSLSIK